MRFHLSLAVVLTIVFIAPNIAPAQTADQTQTGIEEFEAGNLAQAEEIFKDLQKKTPNDPAPTYYLGRIAFNKNDPKTAIKLFEKVTKIEEDNADYHFWLANARFNQIDNVGMLKKMGLARGGKAALDRCLELDPDFGGCHESLARYYEQAPGIAGGSVEKAKIHAKKLREIDPLRGGILLANIHANQKETEEAKAVLTTLLAAFPESTQAHYDAGMFYQEQKDFNQAFDLFEKAVKVAPENDGYGLDALYQIGRTAVFAQKNMDRGIEALAQYQTLEVGKYQPSHASALWRKGMLHNLQGDASKAREAFNQALVLDPDHKQVKAALKEL
ncbi:MAG: TRAP transporter TatT component family protein [Rhodothermales bacterium]